MVKLLINYLLFTMFFNFFQLNHNNIHFFTIIFKAVAKAVAEWLAKKESGDLDSEKNEEENIYVCHQYKVSYI